MVLAIDIEGLTKAFGITTALDGLDLAVTEGEVHGFLGPNGAGKSTTIRILLGLLRADSGTAKLVGGDPWRHGPALHRRLAYVPGDISLSPNLSGGEVPRSSVTHADRRLSNRIGEPSASRPRIAAAECADGATAVQAMTRTAQEALQTSGTAASSAG